MGEPFDAVEVITAKRDGGQLSDAQIDWVIDAYTRGAVAEEQMAALAMAVFWRGLSRGELARWTAAMIASGERLDFSGLDRPTVDKHSTGGVGDKITLPLTPLVAAYGVAVPQLSGRGLGHTGGTLDKLESIPGWRAELTNDQLRRQLSQVGAVICQAGAGLAPADRKLYALRDVTATVAAIPLIASSIMSKKIAEGTAALVLDVKCGSGAFMVELEPARRLARAMVELGTDSGVRTVALVTDMSTPLGLTVGNALEVQEAVEVLAGGGPADVVRLTVALAQEMLGAAADNLEAHGLPAAGLAPGSPAARSRADRLRAADPAEGLASGRAMDSWHRLIAAQGGDPTAALPRARETETVSAEADGRLVRLDALQVGLAAWRLGAGRTRREDAVQAGAGVVLAAKPGDRVRAGQPLMTLHSDTPERFARAREALAGAWTIQPDTAPPAGGPRPVSPTTAAAPATSATAASRSATSLTATTATAPSAMGGAILDRIA
ncbi:MAG: thymidine phosphorylase [Propionibacteriaceae bacterium]|jgi:thymidine phosphorylase|nr:thymidine phosphorylase [Propionibacteriaceae bacterium]